mgnify:CR=1 FL=1
MAEQILPGRIKPALPRLLSHLKPYRRRVWMAVSCSIINKVFDLLPPVLIGLAVGAEARRDHVPDRFKL